MAAGAQERTGGNLVTRLTFRIEDPEKKGEADKTGDKNPEHQNNENLIPLIGIKRQHAHITLLFLF